MGTKRIAQVRRTGSGKYEATVYEVGPKALKPVLIVHGSKALVSRATELAAFSGNLADVADAAVLESGTFVAAVADDGNAVGDLRDGTGSTDD